MLHSYISFPNFIYACIDDEVPIYRYDGLAGQPVPPHRYTKIEFNCLDSIHAQAALDRWYFDVVPSINLIPDFREWLEKHMDAGDAEKVIACIKWYN